MQIDSNRLHCIESEVALISASSLNWFFRLLHLKIKLCCIGRLNWKPFIFTNEDLHNFQIDSDACRIAQIMLQYSINCLKDESNLNNFYASFRYVD